MVTVAYFAEYIFYSHRCREFTSAKLARGARARDTPLTRANHTSWAPSSPAPRFNIPRSPTAARLARSHIFHIPSARPLLLPIIYLVYPLKREPCGPCLGYRRRLPHGIFSTAFLLVSLSPLQRRLLYPRAGDVQRTMRRQGLTYAPSNCGATRYLTG